MTRQEVSALAAVITASYPQFYQRQTPQDLENLIKAWAFALDEYTYEQASIGLKVYIHNDAKGFPPSPGQIIDAIHKTEEHPVAEATAAEAWQIVWDAITRLSWEHPEIEFDRLPPECQRAIGSAESLKEIAMMNTEDVLIGEKARFMRQYDVVKQNVRDYERLPQIAKDRMALLRDIAEKRISVEDAKRISMNEV